MRPNNIQTKNNTQINLLVKLPHKNTVINTESNMGIPPMVGMPILEL